MLINQAGEEVIADPYGDLILVQDQETCEIFFTRAQVVETPQGVTAAASASSIPRFATMHGPGHDVHVEGGWYRSGDDE